MPALLVTSSSMINPSTSFSNFAGSSFAQRYESYSVPPIQSLHFGPALCKKSFHPVNHRLKAVPEGFGARIIVAPPPIVLDIAFAHPSNGGFEVFLTIQFPCQTVLSDWVSGTVDLAEAFLRVGDPGSAIDAIQSGCRSTAAPG